MLMATGIVFLRMGRQNTAFALQFWMRQVMTVRNACETYTDFASPRLQVPFPEVLVGKAYSHDGESVELVLYNGRKAGNFTLGFKNMKAGRAYRLGSQTAVADHKGEAKLSVSIDGRTAITLRPVEQT